MQYLYAFLVGGTLCVIAQVIIDKTKLTTARILTGYVVAGVALGAIGVYQPLLDFAGAGASVPLTGFGSLLFVFVLNGSIVVNSGIYIVQTADGHYNKKLIVR